VNIPPDSWQYPKLTSFSYESLHVKIMCKILRVRNWVAFKGNDPHNRKSGVVNVENLKHSWNTSCGRGDLITSMQHIAQVTLPHINTEEYV